MEGPWPAPNGSLVRAGSKADELIQLAGRATAVDRSEIAIDGLRPEDHEVVSAGGLHKRVSAR